MRTFLINGEVFWQGRLQKLEVVLEDGKIRALETPGTAKAAGVPEEEVYDAAGLRVVPGFIDLHTHGGAGVDVNAADEAGFSKISHFFATRGVTSWQCSILTDTVETTEREIAAAVAHAKNGRNGAHLMGIHLEGPFLAKDYKGAMPEYLLRTADVDLLRHYQELAGGYIHYLTVSPEVEGVLEAIPAMCGLGMTVAMGHSGADYDTAWEAIRRGVRAATHTFNAMKLLHQHFPAIMGAALESDIFCEAICDGRHLHPGTVRFLLKCKGLDRVVAITDSIMAAGLPDGDYKLGVNDVVVEDGDAKLKSDHSRAGSTLTLDLALRNLMAFAGLSLPEVLPLLTENPAKLVHADAHVGTLDPGKDADVVLLDENQFVVDTFVKGEKIVR